MRVNEFNAMRTHIPLRYQALWETFLDLQEVLMDSLKLPSYLLFLRLGLSSKTVSLIRIVQVEQTQSWPLNTSPNFWKLSLSEQSNFKRVYLSHPNSGIRMQPALLISPRLQTSLFLTFINIIQLHLRKI